MGGVDPTRLLVLHEVAEAAWRERAAAADVPAPDDRPARADAPGPRGVRRGVLIGVCATVALGALLVGLLIAARRRTHASSSTAPPAPACRAQGCTRA